jgi:60S ribosome subunit biogenesis protein NIP7
VHGLQLSKPGLPGNRVMRPLSEDETKVFFEKLSTYIGRNIKHLIDRPDEAEILKSHPDR